MINTRLANNTKEYVSLLIAIIILIMLSIGIFVHAEGDIFLFNNPQGTVILEGYNTYYNNALVGRVQVGTLPYVTFANNTNGGTALAYIAFGIRKDYYSHLWVNNSGIYSVQLLPRYPYDWDNVSISTKWDACAMDDFDKENMQLLSWRILEGENSNQEVTISVNSPLGGASISFTLNGVRKIETNYNEKLEDYDEWLYLGYVKIYNYNYLPWKWDNQVLYRGYAILGFNNTWLKIFHDHSYIKYKIKIVSWWYYKLSHGNHLVKAYYLGWIYPFVLGDGISAPVGWDGSIMVVPGNTTVK